VGERWWGEGRETAEGEGGKGEGRAERGRVTGRGEGGRAGRSSGSVDSPLHWL